MHWEYVDKTIIELVEEIPGGTALLGGLLESLAIGPDSKVLDFGTRRGGEALAIAALSRAEVAVLVSSDKGKRAIEAKASSHQRTGEVIAAIGFPAAIPFPDECFDRVVIVADPFPISATAGVVGECLRVLVPGGIVGLAGAASFTNEPPDYLENVLRECRCGAIKTPAYTALQFGRDGFNITRAEYVPGAHDMWVEWLKRGEAPESFERAAIEDNGRWMSMGVVVVRKPSKPDWAV